LVWNRLPGLNCNSHRKQDTNQNRTLHVRPLGRASVTVKPQCKRPAASRWPSRRAISERSTPNAENFRVNRGKLPLEPALTPSADDEDAVTSP
jgi:hypothetical protein